MSTLEYPRGYPTEDPIEPPNECPCEYPEITPWSTPCEYCVSTVQVTAASSAFKGGDRFAHYSIARRRAEASPGPGGHDPKVLTGYSRGTPESTRG